MPAALYIDVVKVSVKFTRPRTLESTRQADSSAALTKQAHGQPRHLTRSWAAGLRDALPQRLGQFPQPFRQVPLVDDRVAPADSVL